jgi:hypothetical protein
MCKYRLSHSRCSRLNKEKQIDINHTQECICHGHQPALENFPSVQAFKVWMDRHQRHGV